MYLHTLLVKQEMQQKAEAKVAGLEAQIAMLRDQIISLQVPNSSHAILPCRYILTCLALSILMHETLSTRRVA